jgi:DNA sulfur modification protein DndE
VTQITLSGVAIKDFRTTKHADELNKKLINKLGFKHRYEPARMAIARSLSIPEQPPELSDVDDAEDGGVIKGQQLFGEDSALWIAMLVHHSGRKDLTIKDIQDFVRRHWHRGIDLLMTEWKECKDKFDDFLLQLSSRAGIREGGGFEGEYTQDPSTTNERLKSGPILLRLGEVGTEVATQKPVRWLMNGKGFSPHLALMGKARSGKTRTGLDMIRQLKSQAGCPVLLFDMEKGDLVRQTELAAALNAKIIKSPTQPIPLNVLHIKERNETEAKFGAARFRDSFKSVMQSRPGAKQLSSLFDGAYRAMLSGPTPLTIKDIYSSIEEVYAEKGQKEDAVTSTFKELTQWDLFVPKMSPREFFSQSWIFGFDDVSWEIRRIVVYLLLDMLYTYCQSIGDTPLDTEGNRPIRLCVGIDEANKILARGHQSLIDLVRRCPSKGIAVFFMSQSPDDYESEDENFLENIGLAISFHTTSLRTRALEKFLGTYVDLAQLPLNGTAVTRLPNTSAPVRFKAW